MTANYAIWARWGRWRRCRQQGPAPPDQPGPLRACGLRIGPLRLRAAAPPRRAGLPLRGGGAGELSAVVPDAVDEAARSAQQIAFQEYLHAVSESRARIARLEQSLRDALAGWSLAPAVAALQALRGVQVLPRSRWWPTERDSPRVPVRNHASLAKRYRTCLQRMTSRDERMIEVIGGRSRHPKLGHHSTRTRVARDGQRHDFR